MRPFVYRAGQGLMVLLLLPLITFLLADLAGGDVFTDADLDPSIPAESAQASRTRSGLDRTGWERYLNWVGGVWRGDLGTSVNSGLPVTQLVGPGIVNTLRLTAPAVALSWLLAIPAGLWLGSSPRRVWPRAAAAANSLLLALPDILVALVLMLLAVQTGWLPAGGMAPVQTRDPSWTSQLAGAIRHLAIPVFTLVIATAPLLIRQVHFSIQAALQSPAVRAAEALGIGRRRVLWGYALPLALNPLISLFGLAFGAQLSLSLLVEVVLGWPGIGPVMLQAVQARDLPVVMAVVLASGLLLIAGNLIGDLLLAWHDPRIRRGNAA